MKPEPLFSTPPELLDDADHGWLSALADGEAQALDAACCLWREDAEARRSWHAYHLIGDVMRSDELASCPARDAAFVAGLRRRLAAEPVVLAPEPAPRRRQPWLVPTAVAAGFAVVAGVLVVARMGQPQPAALELASASSPSRAAMPLGQPQTLQLVSGQALITDARLDEFLRAHQAAGGGVAATTPAGALRRVEVIVPAAADR